MMERMTASRTQNGGTSLEDDSSWAQSGRQPKIAIIGAGFSGMASIIKLRQAGYTDLTCFERADQLGGTWRDNTYPGLSCDVPSHWYSYSFELNPNWSHRFSYGPEIWDYQERVAKKYDVQKLIRFGNRVLDLRYLGPQWSVRSERNGEEIFDFVIAATGILVNPAFPDIPGLDRFEGAKFHSARWDHTVDLAGKRVGIIGTGSTSAQIVGAIADDVGHLDVYQRTPHWIAPFPQAEYSAAWKWLLARAPRLQLSLRRMIRAVMDATFARATMGDEKQQQRIERRCLRHLRQQVPDPELRAHLTPDYKATCKRLILSSDYYPALMKPHVDLITESISEIEPTGIRTADRKLHALDVLVLATGFNFNDFILPTDVYGENGASLREFWDGLPRAHRGIAFPGFPNFFMLQGPTGVFGNTSVLDISEAQIDYVILFLNKMRADRLAAIAPTQEAYEAYNATMAAAIPTTTWATGGCDSWYLDKSGKPNIYPFPPSVFRHEMHNPDFSEYRMMRDVQAQA